MLYIAVGGGEKTGACGHAARRCDPGLDREGLVSSVMPYRITIDDLFFFGSHKYDKAEVVIVTSEPIAGVFVVYDLGSFEPYAWHAAYQDCLQRKQFED